MSSLDKFIREERMHPVYATKFAIQEQYINELQQRIDKAIKFLEKNSFGISYMEVPELLKILKGSDK
jgi:hypothetical protein